MKLGAHLMRFDSVAPARLRDELAATADAAEAAGLSWLSVMDHYFQMESAGFPRTDPMLEAYTTLGFLAGRTSTVQLGVLVTGVTYRHPGLLAKIGATLDVLSGGRATLGIGAAWYEKEHLAFGVPFPPLAERFERLEEALQICRQMWDPEQTGPFEGVHYQLAETICSPMPLSKPEIMVGGSGERKTLRLVAQYADACNLFGSTTEELTHKLEVLDRHCADVGRDPAQVQRTVVSSWGDPLEPGFLDRMREYAALGIEQVWVQPDAADPVGSVQRYGEELVPRLAELG